MLVAGGVAVAVAVGVGVGVVVGVGRPVVGCVDAGCVLAPVLGGLVEGAAADEGTTAAGTPDVGPAAPGSAQLGGVAGTVGTRSAGLAVGEPAVGSREDCAAGEVEAPDVTAGWPAAWAVALPECPVSSLTAA
jgi:hypothetical protein